MIASYEVNNLPTDVQNELSNYAASLINSARQQLGTPEVTVTPNIQAFANKIAQNLQDDIKSGVYDPTDESSNDQSAITRNAKDYGVEPADYNHAGTTTDYYDEALSASQQGTASLSELRHNIADEVLASLTLPNWRTLALFGLSNNEKAEFALGVERTLKPEEGKRITIYHFIVVPESALGGTTSTDRPADNPQTPSQEDQDNKASQVQVEQNSQAPQVEASNPVKATLQKATTSPVANVSATKVANPAKENQVVSAEKNLPQTGDSNTANAIALLLGYLSVFAGIFVGFRKKPDKTK